MRSEKEKMLSGGYYDAGDETLVMEREHARELIYDLNNLSRCKYRK